MNAARPRFTGFHAGAHATLIPNAFFVDVLPLIDDPVELTVTLYALYASGRRPASERFITAASLLCEAPLRAALGRHGDTAADAVSAALDAAVARGTLLADRRSASPRYAINSPAGRRVLALPPDEAAEPGTAPRDGPPPGIYALYEQSIGTLSPLIADELRAAEEDFPPEWIEAAFREAAARNRRSWRYVQRILERWRDEGRNDAPSGRDPVEERDLAGRYRRFVRR